MALQAHPPKEKTYCLCPQKAAALLPGIFPQHRCGQPAVREPAVPRTRGDNLHSTFFSALQMQGFPNPCFGLHLHCFLRHTKANQDTRQPHFLWGPQRRLTLVRVVPNEAPKSCQKIAAWGPKHAFWGPKAIPEIIPKPASWGPQIPEPTRGAVDPDQARRPGGPHENVWDGFRPQKQFVLAWAVFVRAWEPGSSF